MNIAGHVVLSQDFATQAGQSTQSSKVDGSALSDGAYTYVLDLGGDEFISGKLLKK